MKDAPSATATVAAQMEARRELAARVAASPLFGKSPRLREFLLYVCEHALAGRLEQIREQQIGSQVFGRRPDYNMSEDSIVRVEARELRRRLALYFETEGRDEPVLITIPKGGYVPEWTPRHAPPVPPPSEAPAEETARLRWPPTAIAVGTAAILLTVAAAYLLQHERPTATGAQAPAFYRELLGPLASDPRAETLMVLSNPRVMLYFGLKEPPSNAPGVNLIEVPAPLQGAFGAAANNGEEGSRHRYVRITNADYTGMGEAACAFHVGRLMQLLGRPVRLTQGRFLNWESARKEHIILLGGPHINDWSHQNTMAGDFSFVQGGVRNARPRAGEQAFYPTRDHPDSGHPTVDHGLIWMARTPSGSRCLILGGRSSPGTYGVGEFFSNAEKMAPVYEKLRAASTGGRLPDAWQVLVRIDIRDMIPVDATYLTHRVY